MLGSISDLKWPKQRFHFPPLLQIPFLPAGSISCTGPSFQGPTMMSRVHFPLISYVRSTSISWWQNLDNVSDNSYLHDHFCLWTIHYQAVAIETYTSNYLTYLQKFPQWFLIWLGLQSEVWLQGLQDLASDAVSDSTSQSILLFQPATLAWSPAPS